MRKSSIPSKSIVSELKLDKSWFSLPTFGTYLYYYLIHFTSYLIFRTFNSRLPHPPASDHVTAGCTCFHDPLTPFPTFFPDTSKLCQDSDHVRWSSDDSKQAILRNTMTSFILTVFVSREQVKFTTSAFNHECWQCCRSKSCQCSYSCETAASQMWKIIWLWS